MRWGHKPLVHVRLRPCSGLWDTKAAHHAGEGAGVDTQEVRCLAFMTPRFRQGRDQQMLGHGVQVKAPFRQQGRALLRTVWRR